MVAGFSAGALADKIGVRWMCFFGPWITIAACAVMSEFDTSTSKSMVGGILFLSGLGIGFYNSPNATSNMLSVRADQRGAASAVGMMTLMFTSMIGIVLTFSLVLNALSQAEIFDLFIYGGSSLSKSVLNKFLFALKIDYYVVIIACFFASVFGFFNNFLMPNQRAKEPTPDSVDDDVAADKGGEYEMVETGDSRICSHAVTTGEEESEV